MFEPEDYNMKEALKDIRCQWESCFVAEAVIEQANWDTSKTREKLERDIEAHISSVRTAKLAELTTLYEVNRILKQLKAIHIGLNYLASNRCKLISGPS